MVRIWWVFVSSSGGKRWSCYSPRSSDGQETTFLDALLQYTALCSWWGFSTLCYTVVHWWHCPRNWMLGISALTCPAKPLPSPLPNLSHSDWQHFYPHSVSFSSYLWPLYEKSFETVNILDTLELKELVLLIICCVSYAGQLLKLLSELKAFWHAQCTVYSVQCIEHILVLYRTILLMRSCYFIFDKDSAMLIVICFEFQPTVDILSNSPEFVCRLIGWLVGWYNVL